MTLAEALGRDVPERTRTKGNRTFLGGAVKSIAGSDTHVTASVRGTEWYQVNLTRDGDEFIASCECPYFTVRQDLCKHVWAVVLAADAEGFLIGDQPITEDAFLEPEYQRGGPVSEIAPVVPREAPRPVEPWRRFLDNVHDRSAAGAASEVSRYAQGEILYVIDAGTAGDPTPVVQVHWRTRKRNGDWGKPQPAAIAIADVAHLPDDQDREILPQLIGASDPYALGVAYATVGARASFRLAGPIIDRVLPLMARSGRLLLRDGVDDANVRSGDMTALAWDGGEPWVFTLQVAVLGDGRLRVDGTFVRADARMAATEPQLLLSREFLIVEGTIARFDARGAFAWLRELRTSGTTVMPAEAAPKLIEAMALSNVDPSRLPDPLRYELVEATPRPRIRMARASRPQGHGTRDELDAAVEFEYAGTVVPARPEHAGYDAERRRMVRRNLTSERAAIQRLHELGFHRPWYFDAKDGTLAIAVERFPAAVRNLVDEGWHVEAEGRVFRGAKALQMQVTSGVDWFELHGAVDFGDGRSVTIDELLAALRRGEATVILDDGTRGMVPEEWLRRYAKIAAFGEAREGHVRYRPAQTALLDALLETQPSIRIDESFARARAQLAEFTGIQPLDAPPGFRGRLREYQRDALGWFDFLRRFGFGGCLADDMGLGKTVMVLALLESRRHVLETHAPHTSLVVVPRSLVFNWIDEASRFAPGLRVLDYTGEGRGQARLDDFDLVLATYGTVRRDAARLSEFEFDYVILDEAQAIKNASTASAKAARVLRGRHRLALSGTPIENHLGELWSLFEFLNPGVLGPAAAFGRALTPQFRGDRPDLAVIARALRPFILRRTKQQVAPELPEKIEQTIHCELEPPQRRFYDELLAHYRQTLLASVARKGLNRSKMQVLEALLRLRQAASHPGLVDENRSGEASAKFEVLLSRLREIVDEGHKALVFSQFTTLLALLRGRLHEEHITFEYLDGRTRDRAERVARFEGDAACPVFLISLKAGGVGLNLTAADYVFLLDPWWNPAVEAQAIDRAHRIGQTRHVIAYRLIARDTVEEKIAELQQTKRELADALFAEDASLIRTLSTEDLEWILS
jgi:superfamily II DNA or RNA helicase